MSDKNNKINDDQKIEDEAKLAEEVASTSNVAHADAIESENIEANVNSSEATSDVVEDELVALKKELDIAQDQLKRAVADYHNLEKRVSEGRAELAAWATSELIVKLLPSLDNLEKTIKGAGDEEKKSGWFKGVEMSVKQLTQVLKDEGLSEIDTNGQFDPAKHEAVDTLEGKDGQILEVVEKGYNLNGKVLRPAKVVVGRKSK